MNSKIITSVFGAVSLLLTSLAVAAPSVVVENDTVASGNTTTMVTTVFTPVAMNTGAAQFDIEFDKTKLSIDLTAVGNCIPGWVCSQQAAGIRFVSPPDFTGNLAGWTRDLVFNVTLATVGVNYPLTVTNQLYTEGDLSTVIPPSGTQNGSITVLGPNYTSNPVAAVGTEFEFGPVAQNAALASKNLVITNTGVGTLSGTCAETSDPGNVFTITDGAYSAGAGLNDTVIVSCNSAAAPNTYSGQFECSHNGTNVATPVTYDMSCQITPGPQPTYSSSNPAPSGSITLGPTEQGDPNPTQTVNILNVGADGTTLNGSCAMQGPDAEIFISGGNTFSVPKGGSSGITVACNASQQDSYTNTLRCTPTNATSNTPVDYPVSCQITEPGAAVFASSPPPGAIDIDGGADVVVGDTDPTTMLTFFNNADPGDQRLGISCELNGDSAISVEPDISGGILIQPDGGSSSVTFTCDTESANDYTATYSCFHESAGVDDTAGESVPQPNAVYNLSCNVRDPEAQVVPSPAPNTPQVKAVPPGGSTSFQFSFTETRDEEVDGVLHQCYLDAGGQGFTISSPSFPIDVEAGETVNVVVDFTDPTGANTWSDTLICEFSDSDEDDTIVSWPLTVNIGGDARITVLKDFTDGNPGEVTVELDCNTGLILDQDKDISEDGIGVTFVITDYTAGILDCVVTEVPVAGYSADFEASGDSDSSAIDDPDEDAGCYFNDMEGGVENTCFITNSPDPVDVVITKEWLYPGSADGSAISDEFEILLWCNNATIIDGDKYCGIVLSGAEGPAGLSQESSCKWLEGDGNETFEEQVVPYDWPGGECWAVEVDVDQAVEVDNGCAGGIEVSAGSGGSCTITNTVFYEGIPTLSQYGMLLMALLMMGAGFIAVRRFS